MPQIIPTKYMPDDAGQFITAALADTILTFDEYPGQEFDLADLQGSEAKRLRFSSSKDGVVSINVVANFWLIAELDLPAKTYTSEPILDDAGKPVLDKNNNPETITTAMPVTIADLKLTAWQLPERSKS